MEGISGQKQDKNMIEFMLNQQMYTYRYVFDKEFSKQETFDFLKKVDLFYEANWKTYFHEMMRNESQI